MTGENAYSGRRTLANAWKFLVGKGFSAVFTLSLLGFVVRFLPLPEYAVYISAIAALETGLVISSLGIDWVVIRYVPQFVVGGPYVALRRFLISVMFFRFLSVTVFAGIAAMALPYLALAQFVGRELMLMLLSTLFVSEALLRLLRDNTLESLANQTMTQIGVVLRQGLFFTLLAGMATTSRPSTVETVLMSELAASLFALIFSVYAVRTTIRPIKRRSHNLNWTPPAFLEMRRTAWHNYIVGLLSYPYSLQALVLLVATIEEPARVALFGFVVRMMEILRGYLPALLLMNVFRPRLFGIYERTKQFEQPAAEARLISRLSFLTIFPIIVITAQCGDWFIRMASGGRFEEGRGLLLLLVLSLVFRVQRQMVTLLINCLKLTSILVRNATLSLLTFPIFVYLITVYESPFIAAVAVVWDDVLWTVYSIFLLKAAGFKWSADLILITKLTVVSLLCFFFLSFFQVPSDVIGVFFTSIFVVFFYGIYLVFFHPLGSDLAHIRGMISTRWVSNK